MTFRSIAVLVCFATAADAFFAPTATRPALVLRSPVSAQLPRLAKLPCMMADEAAEPAPAEVVAAPAAEEDGMFETLKTGSFFALWYLFNIGYNIYNKKALNALPIPYTMAFLQLAVGIPYVMALWVTGLRAAPKMSVDNVKTLIPVSLGHLGTHIGAVVSLGAGAVSSRGGFTRATGHRASTSVVAAAASDAPSCWTHPGSRTLSRPRSRWCLQRSRQCSLAPSTARSPTSPCCPSWVAWRSPL